MTFRNRPQTAFTLAVMAGIVVAFSGILQADPLIYEPFDDNNSPLNGNTSGLGLTTNWSAGNDWVVTPGSYPAGSLPTSGNRAEIFSGRTRGCPVDC